MIRIGTPVEQGADPGLQCMRGLVKHIGSGRRTTFRQSSELINFLRMALERLERPKEKT